MRLQYPCLFSVKGNLEFLLDKYMNNIIIKNDILTNLYVQDIKTGFLPAKIICTAGLDDNNLHLVVGRKYVMDTKCLYISYDGMTDPLDRHK